MRGRERKNISYNRKKGRELSHRIGGYIYNMNICASNDRQAKGVKHEMDKNPSSFPRSMLKTIIRFDATLDTILIHQLYFLLPPISSFIFLFSLHTSVRTDLCSFSFSPSFFCHAPSRPRMMRWFRIIYGKWFNGLEPHVKKEMTHHVFSPSLSDWICWKNTRQKHSYDMSLKQRFFPLAISAFQTIWLWISSVELIDVQAERLGRTGQGNLPTAAHLTRDIFVFIPTCSKEYEWIKMRILGWRWVNWSKAKKTSQTWTRSRLKSNEYEHVYTYALLKLIEFFHYSSLFLLLFCFTINRISSITTGARRGTRHASY